MMRASKEDPSREKVSSKSRKMVKDNMQTYLIVRASSELFNGKVMGRPNDKAVPLRINRMMARVFGNPQRR